MSNRPYQEILYCPITKRDEEVFFYEVLDQGEWKLLFRGCDHQFHDDNEECQVCHREAYQKLLNRT